MGVALVPLLSNLKRYSPQFATALLTVYIQKFQQKMNDSMNRAPKIDTAAIHKENDVTI